jgi:hypothetical protein
MSQEADPRLLRAVQDRDAERQRRIAAERQVAALRATLARVQADKRGTHDGAQPAKSDARPAC